MKTYKDMVDEKAWQFCRAGHNTHDVLTVPTELGNMQIYDFEKYMGFDGYCSGQDDISRTLKLYGVWEPSESGEIRTVLEAGDRSKFIFDIGAHIGWYSKMASSLGYMVKSFESDSENIRLLMTNAPDVDINNVWIDEKTQPLDEIFDIELMKIDIEGNEIYAIYMLRKSLEAGSIKNIYIEISPTFNDSYPSLISYLEGLGYIAFENGEPFNHDYNFPQTNLLLVRSSI